MKRVLLNIFSSNIPYELSIISNNGIQILNKTINSANEKICLWTNLSILNLRARYNNQIIYQRIHLNCRSCQVVNTSFSFIIFPPQEALDTFTLNDLNYGLPVPNAILNFSYSL